MFQSVINKIPDRKTKYTCHKKSSYTGKMTKIVNNEIWKNLKMWKIALNTVYSMISRDFISFKI